MSPSLAKAKCQASCPNTFRFGHRRGGMLGTYVPIFHVFYLVNKFPTNSRKVPKKEIVTNFVGVPLSCDPMFSSSQILYILFILACVLAETSQAKFQ